jgi:hypothetical protein
MFGTVLFIVALALLVIAAVIWKSDRCDTSAGVISALTAFVLSLVVTSIGIGRYANPWFVFAIGLVSVVLVALAAKNFWSGGGRLPTDFAMVVMALMVGVAVIILVGPMVVTALVTHWQEIPAGWWKFHLLENCDTFYRSLPW